MKYFYHQAKQRLRQETLSYGDTDKLEPDESTYRYDGPKPRFKESAIIFFADSVGRRSKFAEGFSSQRGRITENIFQDRLEDGRIDECPLIFEEAKIKESFIKTTLNMLHSRIEYPEDENEKTHSSVSDRKGNFLGGILLTDSSKMPTYPKVEFSNLILVCHSVNKSKTVF